MTTFPISKQIIFDVFVFLALCVPLLAYHILGKPVTTGFWCNDQSLSYPYKPDSVSQALLLIISFGGTFLVMAITESIRATVKKQRGLGRFRPEILSLSKAYGIFLFGFAANCIFTDTLKFSIGRLRPHFFDLCRPDFDKINCTAEAGLDSSHFTWTNLSRWLTLMNLLQFLVCLLAFVMLKLVSIAVMDIVGSDNFFTRWLKPKTGFLSFMEKKRPVTYPSDMRTNTLLDTRDMCAGVSSYDALMIVHTANSHFEHRQNYRDTYGNAEFTQPYKIKIVFFMGIPPDYSLQAQLLQENTQYGDTVLGNFTDTYHNLTYKAVMSYRWVSQNCQGVKVILKMDDDVILDVPRFFEEFWFPPKYQQELIFCHMWKLAEVERKGKWAISLMEYGREFYPPYCSGFLVVVMPAIVEDLYQTAKGTPFLWLDDVYIYGVVREEMRDVQIINLDDVAYRENHYLACYRQYGYRCKYWGSVLGDTREFLPTMMTLRAARLLYLEQLRPRNQTKFNMTFIMQYECTNKLVDPKLLNDSKLSFPSGHASVSLYSALFTIFYLQLRMKVSFSHLLRPTLQLCVMMLAVLCCLTRVSDHKHFATDVLGGSLLGSSLAWLTFYKIAHKVIPSRPVEKSPPRLPRATSVESEPQTPTPLLRPERLVISQGYRNGSASMTKDFAHNV